EKLLHGINADCVPIYWGDPEIGAAFNVRRFIAANDYLAKPTNFLPRFHYSPHALAHTGQVTFIDRAKRRLNSIAIEIEQRTWARFGFDALIDRIVETDRDDELYLQHLREPFLIGNALPDRSRWIARWKEILNSALPLT